ncbi:MAG: DUF362 domain-containing protein [Methylocystaceae bacterium]
MGKVKLEFDYEVCAACGVCVQACPFSYLELENADANKAHQAYPVLVPTEKCSTCGICAEACPLECIKVNKPLNRKKGKSYVFITDAPPMNYLIDYVALPKNYGTPAYFVREDVKAIRDTVYRSLNDLNEKTNFSKNLVGRRVLIKPNLVMVYHRMGFKDEDYPESTDPRVFEAVVSYVKQYTDDIVIIESSGRGMPTGISFKISGLDRVARHYSTGIMALEQQPVVRYMLPQAEVMKEVYVPRILEEVIQGDAYYISVPKMKTNLYTGVTLGFKNAMGTIPYNLRQRNHNYLINKKLVDLLYLFKPDLTVIDGIIGGEGCTPAPVDPVEVGVIICGNNSVETDRVATRMMGFNPDENKLMVEAVKKGFHDDTVTVIGEPKVVPFRPADPTMMDERFQRDFPNVRILVGHMKNTAPKINDIEAVTPALVRQMEKACDGGCLAATKTSFEMMKYGVKIERNFPMVIIFGAGVMVNGQKYWFDAEGKPYTIEDIKQMKVKRVTIGECTRDLKPYCEYNGQGCCSPNSCMDIPFNAIHKLVPPMSIRNHHLVSAMGESLKNYLARRRVIKSGQWLDCDLGAEDKIYELPELTAEQQKLNYIPWPLPEMTSVMKKEKLKQVKLLY